MVNIRKIVFHSLVITLLVLFFSSDAVMDYADSKIAYLKNDQQNPGFFFRKNNKDKILVMVHGVVGSGSDTWRNREHNTYWPRIIAEDSRFDGYDIFVVSYFTPSTRQSPNIYQLAAKLNEDLWRHGIYTPAGEGKNSYNEVVFVAHSMGNLVLRTSMITESPSAHAEMIPLILSLGSPSLGSNAAEFVERFSDNPTFDEMARFQNNSFLPLMNRIWKSQRFDTEIACAFEKKPMNGLIMIVDRESAIEVCTRPVTDASGIDENHEDMVKPSGQKHQVHEWLWQELSAPRNRKGWELERWSHEIIIGGKDYPESNIHVAMMALLIENELGKMPGNSIKVKRLYQLGNAEKLYSDLRQERIDIYPEYSGSLMFAYMGIDPIELSNANGNRVDLIERRHTSPSINRELRREDFNIEFYPQFGYDSPFRFVMLKQVAAEMGLLRDGKVKMSEFARHSSRFLLSGDTGFFYRNDGYVGYKRFYSAENLGFARTNYIRHTDVYDALRNSAGSGMPVVVVGYGTDHEIMGNDNHEFVVIEDDKGFLPIHRVAPLAHRFLDARYPQVRVALSRLENAISELDMAMLLKAANEIWKDIPDEQGRIQQEQKTEALARQFLESRQLL